VMSEASWAAAGMLSGHHSEHPPQMAPLAGLSEQLYPGYLQVIEGLSGKRVPLRTHRARLTGNHSPVWMDEASLDPRDLCVALPAAARAANVDIQEDVEMLAVVGTDPSGTEGSVEVETSSGVLHANAFVNCCGAWAPGVEPYKGQILTVRLPHPSKLDYVVRSPDVYLVPRGDGRVVIGATVERVGFDRRIEPEALKRLRAHAALLWPEIATAEVEESWTGLRPGTDDCLPVIGSTGQPGCFVASGHFRNGILLAPATALVMRQLLQGETPAVSLEAFTPARLGASDNVVNAAL
jgi:glycine oxidase